jgi:1-deoxy-D-xylulose-5-phosphate reductoisomerase
VKKLAILGSTGSIGRNTLQVVREMGGQFAVSALAAGGNAALLAEQALEFRPEVVSLSHESVRDDFWRRLRASPGLDGYKPEALHGPDGNMAVATGASIDVLVSAAVGVAGLAATYRAVAKGTRVALANKETLVAGGELVMAAAQASGAEILPVDSEHNGVHQCLRAGRREEVDKLILTASGGPFRKIPREELDSVTPQQALNHPTWKMGNRITVDSATLMNKGFEVIEACWLFGFSADEVEVVVHPQSIVHAMVEYRDGSVIAQLCPPDMKMPIRYALSYPERQTGLENRRLSWTSVRQLEFEPPDWERFPLLGMAYRALRTGGAAGCILNAADEIAVEAFLSRRIRFSAIPRVVEAALETVSTAPAASVEELLVRDQSARQAAREAVERLAEKATA